MNRRLKQALATGLMVVGVGWFTKVQAASTDTMTVSVTPNATYGVSVTTPAGYGTTNGFDFGIVNLNTSTQSTNAIILTNTGSIYEYFGMSISNTSGGWAASAVAPTTDTFRLSALLNNPSSIPAISSTNFTALANNPPGTASTQYGQAALGKTSPTTGAKTQNLWLRLEMPFTLNTGGTGTQTMTLSVTGQAS